MYIRGNYPLYQRISTKNLNFMCSSTKLQTGGQQVRLSTLKKHTDSWSQLHYITLLENLFHHPIHLAPKSDLHAIQETLPRAYSATSATRTVQPPPKHFSRAFLRLHPPSLNDFQHVRLHPQLKAKVVPP